MVCRGCNLPNTENPKRQNNKFFNKLHRKKMYSGKKTNKRQRQCQLNIVLKVCLDFYSNKPI